VATDKRDHPNSTFTFQILAIIIVHINSSDAEDRGICFEKEGLGPPYVQSGYPKGYPRTQNKM
jgi:hypothetical protein